MRTYNLDKKTGIKDDGDNRWYERGGVESWAEDDDFMVTRDRENG
jgi:hypothetical protein